MTKVATEDKAKEFITLHFLKFMRVSEEIKNKNKKNSELQCLDQDFWVSSITTCMLKVRGNLVYDLLLKKLRSNY